MCAYPKGTRSAPSVRTDAPWLCGMRDERPECRSGRARISGAERVAVATVLIAVVAFEGWFFFLSGAPMAAVQDADKRRGSGSSRG